MNIGSLLGFGLALASVPEPAPLVLANNVPTANVRLDDLDLSKEQDVALLRARVRAAVRTVCSDRHNPGILYPEAASCRQDAMARADAAVRNALERHADGNAPLIASILISRDF